MDSMCNNCEMIKILKEINGRLENIENKMTESDQSHDSESPIPLKRKLKRKVIEDESDEESEKGSSEFEFDEDFIPQPRCEVVVSPHDGFLGCVKFHCVDGPYILGDPDLMPTPVSEKVNFENSEHHYIRWLVNSNEVESECKTEDTRQTYYYCDWEAQIVEQTHPQQLKCHYQWLEWSPERTKTEDETPNPFIIAPKFYSYSHKKVYDFSTIKKIFMRRVRTTENLYDKRVGLLEEVEKAFGVAHFKFGNDSNVYASDELRDWAVFHYDVSGALKSEKILQEPVKGLCTACNSSRTLHSFWGGGNIKLGPDCATRLRCLFAMFEELDHGMSYSPSEKDFNHFMFRFIGLFEQLNVLKIANNKRIRR